MNPTQEMIKRLFLSIAISVAAFIAGTSSVTAAPTMCDGFLPAGTYDTVIVPEGKTCTVAGGVTVNGSVIVQEGASLQLDRFGTLTVNGSVILQERASLQVPPNANGTTLIVNVNLLGDGVSVVNLNGAAVTATILGNVSITGATGGVALHSASIGGNLNISDSNGGVFANGLHVGGNALFLNNTTDVTIIGALIDGNLVCNGNDPAPVLQGTITVGGKRIGQCAQ